MSSVELFDRSVGVSEWFSLLNWETLPDMGACHTFAANGENEKFLRRFVMTKELEVFAGSLAEKFESGRVNQPVVALLGLPGIGKTTFVYLLSQYIHNNELLKEKYTFYPFQANNICNVNWKYEVLSNVKDSLEIHFKTNGNKEDFDEICNTQPDTEKGLEVLLNHLKTYLSRNRNKFNKTLIFVLDNVDTVSNSKRVLEAFDLINTVLEPAFIKKWFVVRPETLDGYASKDKKRFDSFNADKLVLPKVSLYDVVSQRIQTTTNEGNTNHEVNPLNPFDTELCNTVSSLCNGNLRRGLSVIESLLRDISPKGFPKNTDESVLQNYLRKSAVPILFKQDLLVNLHSTKYSTKTLESPFAYDLLCLIEYTSQPHLLRALLYEATERRNRVINYEITGRDSKFTIQDHEMIHLLEKLHELGLVVFNSEEDSVVMTSFGKAHVRIATSKFFATICKEEGFSTRSESYWRAANITISYSSISNWLSTSKIV